MLPMLATRNASPTPDPSTRPSPQRSGSTHQHHCRRRKSLPRRRDQVGRQRRSQWFLSFFQSCPSPPGRWKKWKSRRSCGISKRGGKVPLLDFSSERLQPPFPPPFPPSLSTLNSHATCLKLVDTLRSDSNWRGPDSGEEDSKVYGNDSIICGAPYDRI